MTKINIRCFFIFYLIPHLIFAQSFENIGDDQNIQATAWYSTYGHGASFYDFDHDGWDDLTFGQFDGPIKCYKNNEGTFELVDLGVADMPNVRSIIWVDFDNDGDSDLFMTNKYGGCKLYRNQGDMNLVNISNTSGLFADQMGVYNSYGSAWGDYDKDGFLDVYIGNWEEPNENEYNFLYHNNGDGTFTDVTFEAGVENGHKETLMPVWIDIDQDGWLDLHVINDKLHAKNSLYKNNANGTFTDIAGALHLDTTVFAMSNSFGDFDNDRDFDLYISNLTSGNVFYRNDGGYFSNIETEFAVQIFGSCWSANWVDFDNDMVQDLYVCTDFYDGPGSQNFAFVNYGSIFIPDTDIFPNNNDDEFVSISGDINNDGRIDICNTPADLEPANLWLNTSDNSNNYIKVSLEGVLSNRDGISSLIEVFTEDIVQSRYTFCGEDYMAQDSQREIIGLGTYETIDSIYVSWLSGHVDKFYDISTNQTLHIVEGSSIKPSITHDPLCEDSDIQLHALAESFESLEWNNGSTEETILLGDEEFYFVTITTDLGLQVTSDTLFVELNQNPIISQVSNNPSCFGLNNGSIELINESEGELAQVLWNNDLTGLNIDGLVSGSYSYTAIDINGCETQGSILLSDPEDFEIFSIPTNPSCSGICDGELTLLVFGGTGANEIEGDLENICAGIHSFSISDENGCTESLEIEFTEPDPIIVEYQTQNTSCFGECEGTLSFIIEGGTGNFILPEDTVNLCAGNYDYIISDDSGCMEAISIEIEQPDQLNSVIEFGLLDEEGYTFGYAEPFGGTPPYDFLWSNGETTDSISNLTSGINELIITDALGCEYSVEFDIPVGIKEWNNELLELYPNPTSTSIQVNGLDCIENPFIELYSAQGKFIKSEKLSNNQISVIDLAPGLYILKITCHLKTTYLKFLKSRE